MRARSRKILAFLIGFLSAIPVLSRGSPAAGILRPERLQTFAEKLGIIAELPELLGADVGSILAGDDAEGGEDLGANRRGHGARVGATRGELANSSDGLVVSRYVPTRRAERFGKRSHHDVDILGIHAELLAHASRDYVEEGPDGSLPPRGVSVTLLVRGACASTTVAHHVLDALAHATLPVVHDGSAGPDFGTRGVDFEARPARSNPLVESR